MAAPLQTPAIIGDSPEIPLDSSVPAEDDVPALITSNTSSVASSEADEEVPELDDEQGMVALDDEEEDMNRRDAATLHARAKEAATILLSQMLSDREEDQYSSRWATPMSMSTYHLSRLGLEPLQLMLNTPPSTVVPPSKATSVYCLDDDEEELPTLTQRPSSTSLFLRLQ